MLGIAGPGWGKGLMRPILFLLCSGAFWLGLGRGGAEGAVLQFFEGDFRFPGDLEGVAAVLVLNWAGRDFSLWVSLTMSKIEKLVPVRASPSEV